MIRRLARRILGRSAGVLGRSTRDDQPSVADPVADAEDLSTIDVDAQEIVERVDAGESVLMLDVRGDEQFARGAIAGARHIPLDQLALRWEELRNDDEIVCYSGTGQRSQAAARLLRERGLFNATSLEGGLAAWQQFGGAMA